MVLIHREIAQAISRHSLSTTIDQAMNPLTMIIYLQLYPNCLIYFDGSDYQALVKPTQAAQKMA